MAVVEESTWTWPGDLAELHERFRSATPFPHIVLDDVFRSDVVAPIYDDIPDPDDPAWIRWGGGRPEDCDPIFAKRGISDVARLPASSRFVLDELTCDRFVDDLCILTGTPGLSVDRTFSGGGLHCSGQGAALRIHADPIRHPHPDQFDQAINLILYVNPEWEAAFGGNLELWSRDCARCEVSIAPMFNRLVIFQADRSTFHGHPSPNTCPPGQYRTSLALYYYARRAQDVALESNRPIWR